MELKKVLSCVPRSINIWVRMRGKLQLNLIQQVFSGYLLTMLLNIKLLRFHGSGRISKKELKETMKF